MSEKKEATKEVATAEQTLNTSIEQGSIGDMLSGARKKGFSLTSDYLSMEDGEARRFAVMSLNKMTVEDKEAGKEGQTKEIEVLLMIDENGSTVSAGQTVLVNSIKNQIPCMVEIVCKGEIKMAGGRKYTAFDVFPLDDINS